MSRAAIDRVRGLLPDRLSPRLILPVVLILTLPALLSPLSGASEEEPTGNGAVDVAEGPQVERHDTGSDGGSAEGPTDHAPDTDPVFDARPVVADDVQPVRPDLLVRPPQRLEPSSLFSVLGLDGVEHLAGAAEQNVSVGLPDRQIPMKVLVVDPAAFRPLTPEVTARSKEVWERLASGEAVVRHDIAKGNGIELGSTVAMTGPSGEQVDVRVGAFASNGTPPLAEAIVPWEVGGRLGVSEPNLLVVALTEGTPRDVAGQQLQQAVGGGDVTELEEPSEQQASLVGAGSHRFESFSYIDHGDGMITIDPAWVRRNIVYAEVPIFGTVRCHKDMIPQLRSALQEVVDAGLTEHIDTSDYGGCWVPRHILFDPSRPLSMHSWGLAIDFNVQTNMYGEAPTLDRRIVEIFERWGFEWGGDWRTPDGMHFELDVIIK